MCRKRQRRKCATLPFCERVIRFPRSKYLPSRNRKVPVPRNPTTIGGHLRRRRLQLNIFQPEAAHRLNVSTIGFYSFLCWPTNVPGRSQRGIILQGCALIIPLDNGVSLG